jgi:putative DNA primase/helicase
MAKEVRMTSTEFDAHPTLLNVANGVVDLETGALLPHRPGLYLTHLSPVRFDPDATHPLWDRYLWDVTGGDTEMMGFLARAVGYSIQAYNPDRVIFFVHGPGATGKSTFVEAVMAMLGSYAEVAPFDTFLADPKSGRARDDLIDIKDARLVVSNETEAGKTFSANVVKSVSGGDMVKARRLYATEWTRYRAPYTLWLVANHTPRIDHRDEAMWDRFVWIPFLNRIAHTQRDPRIKDALCDPTTCGPAILAWAVRGYLDWRDNGLQPPARVIDAGAEQRRREDPLGEFKQACVTANPAAWTPTKMIVAAFRAWCEQAHDPPKIGDRQLISELAKDFGLRPVTKRMPDGSNARAWVGISVRMPDEGGGPEPAPATDTHPALF